MLPPQPATSAPVAIEQPASVSGDTGASPATSQAATATRPILYVQLAPGQTAPPGATVIDAAAPTSGAGGVRAPAPVTKQAAPVQAVPPQAPPVVVAPPKPAPTPIVIKTTQSGKVVP